MDGNTIFFGLVGLVIYICILHGIITSASRGKHLRKEARIQTDLMIEMAKKQGVSDEKILEILKKYTA